MRCQVSKQGGEGHAAGASQGWLMLRQGQGRGCGDGGGRGYCGWLRAPCSRNTHRGTRRPLLLPSAPPPGASSLRKVYRPMYIWGQLSGWFKQTVSDPTASLSAERRGTVSLPDVESAFAGGKARYTAKVLWSCCRGWAHVPWGCVGG